MWWRATPVREDRRARKPSDSGKACPHDRSGLSLLPQASLWADSPPAPCYRGRGLAAQREPGTHPLRARRSPQGEAQSKSLQHRPPRRAGRQPTACQPRTPMAPHTAAAGAPTALVRGPVSGEVYGSSTRQGPKTCLALQAGGERGKHTPPSTTAQLRPQRLLWPWGRSVQRPRNRRWRTCWVFYLALTRLAGAPGACPATQCKQLGPEILFDATWRRPVRGKRHVATLLQRLAGPAEKSSHRVPPEEYHSRAAASARTSCPPEGQHQPAAATKWA